MVELIKFDYTVCTLMMMIMIVSLIVNSLYRTRSYDRDTVEHPHLSRVFAVNTVHIKDNYFSGDKSMSWFVFVIVV